MRLDGVTQVRRGVGAGFGGHGPVGKILAGAEAAAVAGDQQGPAFAVLAGLLHLAEGVTHLPVHGFIEAVEAVRAVQNQRGHAVLKTEFDGVEGHEAPLF